VSRVRNRGLYRKAPLWRAEITVNGKTYKLGSYPTPEEAHAAYCAKAKELHGEFARTG
jgi:hypothetical protein